MATPPSMRISQFATSGVNPSGVRHLMLPSSGWIKTLGTAAGQSLDFGSLNVSDGKQTTTTYAVVAMIDDFNDANEAVFNLRFFISDLSDWTTGTFFFNGFPSGKWIQNINLTDTSGFFIPTALPSGQNWWRDAGGVFDRDDVAFQEITASGTDSQVTQWFYMSTTIDTNVAPKTYGGSDGGWKARCTFDFR